MIKSTILNILFFVISTFGQNSYLVEFNKLPDSYKRNGEPLGQFLEQYKSDDYKETRRKLTTGYSWAVPTEESIDAIVEFSGTNGIIDFGAGSGYWASLIANRGVNVIAVDNWVADKPNKLWFDVQTGSYEYLTFAKDRTLMMVWIPQWTDMGITALRTWNGNKLIIIGEPAPTRSNASPAFFEELDRNWVLMEMIEIPQWFNRNDAVFFYKRI